MTDPLMTLSAADPVRDHVPTAAEVARMDSELARLLALEAAPEPRSAAPRSRPGRRWIAVPIAAAAVFAALALAVPDRGPRPLQPAAASAATVLADLGKKVAAAPAASGRYAYERRLSYVSHMRPRPSGKGTFVVVLPHEDEQWVTDDGSAIVRNVIHEDQPTFPTPEDKADYDAAGTNRPPLDSRPHTIDAITVAGLSAAQVRALPTDPAALRARIEGGEVTLTGMVGQLLATALTPPEVKVALFEVLKGLPGATLVPRVTDPQGRTGVGVQFDTPAWKTLFLFDPKTGALLGTRSIGHKEIPGRDIDDWSLVLESNRRDDAPPTVR
jgi:hypothetical protein